ncbi:ferredoxin [Streptomyces shenzhenensis]|uniref:ferredoxin n=1 Tax=Streptomyces shenzhenensis TaxID=943815 RepID=UPI00382B18D4
MSESTEQKTGLHFKIDADLCVGHGRCYTLASQWFDCDDIGYAEVKDVAIGDDERAHAEDVAAACPEGAISLLQG